MANEKEAIKKALREFSTKAKKKALSKDKQTIIVQTSNEVIRVFAPLFKQMRDESRISKEELKTIAREIADKINIPEINIPELIMPSFPEIPEPKVTVNVDAPIVSVPPIEMPDEMTVNGWVNIGGFDRTLFDSPIPVQLRDKDGNPMNLADTIIAQGGGGGGARIVKISNILDSSGASIVSDDGALKVEGAFSSGGLTDAELRATSVPVSQASGSIWSVSVNDIFRTTVTSTVLNSDNRLRVSVETGGSGLTDAELRASSVPVAQASGAAWSVFVKEIFASAATDVVNPDGRLKVELPTGSSGLTDTELRASSVPVSQASGANWSVSVTNTVTVDGSGVTQPISAASLPLPSGAATAANQLADGHNVTVDNASGGSAVNIQDGGNSITVDGPLTDAEIRATGLPVHQVSGFAWSVSVNDVFGTVGTGLINPDNRMNVSLAENAGGGTQYAVDDAAGGTDTGTLSLMVRDDALATITPADGDYTQGRVDQYGNTWVSLGTRLGHTLDSISVQQVSGATHSTLAHGISRTANPSATADGSQVVASYDDIGRQISRPLQARDLLQTAYVTASSEGPKTLLAGVASTFHDLVYLMGANESDAAITVDITQTTGGTVQATLVIPANSTAGLSLAVPIPQDHADATWQVDNNAADNSNTTYSITALFSKEV